MVSLLFVLEIGLIILLSILGCLSVFILMLFLIPAPYHISAEGDGAFRDIKITVGFNVLWVLFRLRFDYPAKQPLRMRFLGFPLSAGKKKEKEEETPEESPEEETSGENISSLYLKLCRLCDKISKVMERLGEFGDFCSEEDTKEAARLLGRCTWNILRSIRPRMLAGKAVLGLSDPSYTGYVFGFLSLWVPDTAELTPDFEQEIFSGTLSMRGHIVFGAVLFHLLCLMGSRSVRITIMRLKKLKLLQRKTAAAEA